MTIPPPLRSRLRDGERGSRFTSAKVGADLELGVDLVADPDNEELAAMRRGCQLPRRRLAEALDGGIVSTGALPPSMCSMTASIVWPGTLHQRLRPAVLFRGGGGRPS
jgi:hypothetical protein